MGAYYPAAGDILAIAYVDRYPVVRAASPAARDGSRPWPAGSVASDY
jgi:hypothetical protein